MVKRKSKRAKRKTPTSKKEINKQRQIIGIVLIAVLIVAGLFVAFIGGRTTGAATRSGGFLSWFDNLFRRGDAAKRTCVDTDGNTGGGIYYGVAGYVTYTDEEGNTEKLEDKCLFDINGNAYILERICSNDGYPQEIVRKCEECKDGAGQGWDVLSTDPGMFQSRGTIGGFMCYCYGGKDCEGKTCITNYDCGVKTDCLCDFQNCGNGPPQ